MFEYNKSGKVAQKIIHTESNNDENIKRAIVLNTYNSDVLILSKSLYSATASEFMTEDHLVYKNSCHWEKY